MEHPLDSETDIGRNSFLTPKIRKTFEHAYEVIVTVISQGRSDSYLSYVIRADDPLLLYRHFPKK